MALQHFPFMRLPPEIEERILRIVASDTTLKVAHGDTVRVKGGTIELAGATCPPVLLVN